MPGVLCERVSQAAGLGWASMSRPGRRRCPPPLIMLAVPAVIAGCPEDRSLHAAAVRTAAADPAVLAAAAASRRVAKIFKVGGCSGYRGDGFWHRVDSQGAEDIRTGQRLGYCR